MDKNSRHKSNRGAADAARGETRNIPGAEGVPHHAADLINRALFDEWLHKYGSWDAFLDSVAKERRSGSGESEDDPEGPEVH